MRLVGQQNADAFEVIFDRHADASFSLACGIFGGRSHHAEEVVQEAFLSVWRGGARYDESRGAARSWILQAVRNRAIDRLRSDRVHVGSDVHDEGIAEHLVGPDSTELQVERSHDASQMREALDVLPDDQRAVIELAYYSGLTQTEIADALSLPLGTVKGRMRLGLGKLREALEGSMLTASAA